MLPLGMILGFVGYGVGTWGYILAKGYNITLREWFSPLRPFTGALDSNGMVPSGSIFPTSGKGAKPQAGSGAGNQVQAQSNARAARAGRPPPGSVPGRL